MKQLNVSVNDTILGWLKILSQHFGIELSEDQVEIFTHALRNNTVYQINIAFERCLNENQFMPKLADVHRRMPEQRHAAENPGRFVLCGPPILDLIRPIAKEICKGMTGREYDDLDTVKDDKLIFAVFAEANLERYRRMGIDPERWHGSKGADEQRTEACFGESRISLEEHEEAYKQWLQEEARQDAIDRKAGLPPLPRSQAERLAIYMNLPLEERKRRAKSGEWIKLLAKPE